MTFRPDRYPTDWKQIRARILARAGDKCERCKAPNHEWISRDKNYSEHTGAYMTMDGRTFLDDGTPAGWARGSEWEGSDAIKVVLTVAHLDHVESNNGDTNLAALCQRCHLQHDRADNVKRRRRNRRAKLAARELF